jgi:O-antigen/teichoic acid export membrane protein
VGLFGLAHFTRLNSFTSFLLMGFASLVSASLLLWRLGLLSHLNDGDPGTSWGGVLRENWAYGRWLVGSTVLFSISSQTQTFLVAGFLGLGAAGVLRAMQLPSLIMTQVTTAAGLLVLPAFSSDFGKGLMKRLRYRAMLVSVGLVGAALVFAALLALFAARIEHLLFAGKYAAYAWLMPLLALMPVCTGLSMGYSMAMRAAQKPHFDLVANAIAAPVAVLSTIFFLHWWGLPGGAASMILSFFASLVVILLSYRLFIPVVETSSGIVQ